MRRIFFGGILAVCLVLSRVGFCQISYSITDLGTLGGSTSSPTAINDLGQVVGSSTLADGSTDAFLYTNGNSIDLGILTGGTGSAAYGINDLGQVAGTSSGRAYLYTNGSMLNLGTVEGDANSSAAAINDSGEIVGYSGSGNISGHAMSYSDGTMVYLGHPFTQATGINTSGQIVGSTFAINSGDYSSDEAFLYSSDGPMIGLSAPVGYTADQAFGINDSGQVVGETYTESAGPTHAWVYSSGSSIDLGTLGGTNSAANAINGSSEIVGYSNTLSGSQDAFVYSGNTMIDLNSLIPSTSGWTLQTANAINNLGQIVGTGTNASGQTHGFLLTPIGVPIPTQTPSVNNFPAPTSLYTPALTAFLQNHSGEFSSLSQQILASEVTPQTILDNANFKEVSYGAGVSLKAITYTTDVLLGSTSYADAANYIALMVLPPKYSNWISANETIDQLAFDAATKADPVVDLIALNSFIYGTYVAPQLISLGQDPFDPDYATPVVITAFPVLNISNSGDSITATLSREFSDETRAVSYLQAANTAYNRYSSALESSDAISAGMQLESLFYYMGLYRSAIAMTASDSADVNDLLPSSEIGDVTYDPSSLASLQTEIQEDGLSASTISFLQGLGLTETDINQVEENILAINPNSISGDLYGELASASASITIPEPGALALFGGSTLFLLGARYMPRQARRDQAVNR